MNNSAILGRTIYGLDGYQFSLRQSVTYNLRLLATIAIASTIARACQPFPIARKSRPRIIESISFAIAAAHGGSRRNITP